MKHVATDDDNKLTDSQLKDNIPTLLVAGHHHGGPDVARQVPRREPWRPGQAEGEPRLLERTCIIHSIRLVPAFVRQSLASCS
jgi:hypothetical protein